ncbi:hypothetical protein D3C71_1626900 [compost metagenome]
MGLYVTRKQSQQSAFSDAASCKDADALPLPQRQQAVDAAHSRFQDALYRRALHRIDRLGLQGTALRSRWAWLAIQRRTEAVDHAPAQCLTDADLRIRPEGMHLATCGDAFHGTIGHQRDAAGFQADHLRQNTERCRLLIDHGLA